MAAHWPEYLMESANLGAFMISACLFTVLLENPESPVRMAIGNSFARRAFMGLAMGLTAVLIILSPFGKRSGAHMNPSVTLTFFALGKIRGWDAVLYGIFQFLGGSLGVAVALLVAGAAVGHPSVRYAVTMPGSQGLAAAFAAEALISYLLMTMILTVSNSRSLARYTPFLAGLSVAVFIAFEAPLSGMSMNPARTFGSALWADVWTALWIYFFAPPLGMLLAAQVYRRRHGLHRVFCAKLHHHNDQRCIFRCNYGALDSGDQG